MFREHAFVGPTPFISMMDKPQAVIPAMGAEGHLNWMPKRMCEDSPAYAADGPTLSEFTKMGIEPWKPMELGKLDPAVRAAVGACRNTTWTPSAPTRGACGR